MTLVFDTSTLTTPELIIVPLVTLVVLTIGIISIRYSRSFKKKVRDGILLEATGEIVALCIKSGETLESLPLEKRFNTPPS